MTMQVTLSDKMYRYAEFFAQITGQSIVEVLEDGLMHMISGVDEDSVAEIMTKLPDDEVIYFAESKMDHVQNQRMSELLQTQQAGQIDDAGREELESLLKIYDKGTMIKSYALNEAIQRGLRPPIKR